MMHRVVRFLVVPLLVLVALGVGTARAQYRYGAMA